MKILHSPLFYASLWYCMMLINAGANFAEQAKGGGGIFAIIFIIAGMAALTITLVVDIRIRCIDIDLHPKLTLLSLVAVIGWTLIKATTNNLTTYLLS